MDRLAIALVVSLFAAGCGGSPPACSESEPLVCVQGVIGDTPARECIPDFGVHGVVPCICPAGTTCVGRPGCCKDTSCLAVRYFVCCPPSGC